MKEGLVVNNLIKEPVINLNSMYDSLVIPEKAGCGSDCESENKKKSSNKSLRNLMLTTLGVFGALAGATSIISLTAKRRTKLPPWKCLPEVPKNISINDEPHFAAYLMIQNPNTKTVLGALGVFVLSTVGLVGKNFVDGVRSIWVRKKEADVQRDLQEKLIAVETRSFSGKMQILRNMLSEKAHELEGELQKNNLSLWDSIAFKQFISFGKKNPMENKTMHQENSDDKKGLGLILLYSLGVLAIGGLGVLSYKNVQKTAKYYEKYAQDMVKTIEEMAKKSDASPENLDMLKKMCISLRLSKEKIQEIFALIKKPAENVQPEILKKYTQHTNIKDALKNIKTSSQKPEQQIIGAHSSNNKVNINEYVEGVLKDVESLTQKPAQEIAGTPGDKPMYYSHTNDDRAHLYNMIVNPENPFMKILFAGMATVTTAGYTGQQAIEAVKDVEVIKENANTELNLQNRLVNVELKNFETKKKSVIEPLISEFKTQSRGGKNKEELKVRAENILYEIKNGPPFVYS